MIVKVVKAYIEDQQTDVIVNTTTASLTLSVGEVSGAILKASGQELQTECYAKYPQGIKSGDVAVTKGGNLNCKFVYHVALSGSWTVDQEDKTKSVVEKCLQTADDAGHKSISFPLLGTGLLQYPRDVVTHLIRKAATNFKAQSLEKVKIVELPTCHGTKRTSSELKANKQRLKTLPPECSPKKLLKLSDLVNTAQTNKTVRNQMCFNGKWKKSIPHTSSMSSPEPSTSQTSNNAGTASKINIAMVPGNIVLQEVDVIVLSAEPDLSFYRENIRREVAQTAGVSVQEDIKWKYPNGLKYGEIGRTSGGNLKCKYIFHVVLPPFKDNAPAETIYKALIYACLKKASLHQQTSIAFPLLGCGTLKYPADNVAIWLCETVQDFDVRNPDGFLKEVQIVVLSTHEQRFEVLQKKDEKPTSSITAGIQLNFPTNWSTMEQQDFFKIVPLQRGEVEYGEVAKSFSVSSGCYTIVSIERIQNQTLYLQYQVMRKLFESRNPGIDNEQTLWHGTSAEATTSINMHGFNRSYCGKNATFFGNGVYFARTPGYSAQDTYTPKDKHGLKRMYQAKVLTGKYTVGHFSYRVPPPKDPSKPHDRFDCVVDNITIPSMFVIFQDAQAYPCYLITFK